MSGHEQLFLPDSRVEELLVICEMERGEASRFVIPYTLQKHQVPFQEPTILYKSICLGAELLGFLILVPDPDGLSVEFRRIVVSRPGHGIGKRAVEMVSEFCRHDLGRKRAWLDVFETNHRARQVYERCGYQRFGSSGHQERTLLLYELTGQGLAAALARHSRPGLAGRSFGPNADEFVRCPFVARRLGSPGPFGPAWTRLDGWAVGDVPSTSANGTIHRPGDTAS